MKLQINTAGAWKDVGEFEPERRTEVLKALHVLDQALGAGAKWCLVDDDGKREWLDMPKAQPQSEPSCAHSHLPGGLGCVVCESLALESKKVRRP